MRSSALLFLAALLATAACVDLRKIELDILKSSRQALLLFRADGCKECDRVEEVLGTASSVLPTTPFASVNCNKEPEACDESAVFSVPTLKFAPGNGDLITYKETVDVASVVRYLERQSGSPVKSLRKDEVLDFAASSRVVVVSRLGPSASEEHRKVFDAVAEKWRTHYSFGSIDGTDDETEEGSIIVYSQDRDYVVNYNGVFNMEDIEAFLQDATKPLIHEFDPLVRDDLDKSGKSQAQIFFDRQDERRELARSLYPLATKYAHQMAFVTVHSWDYNQQCDRMHIERTVKRGFAIADLQGRAYPMSNATAFNANRITQHIEAYLAGSLKPAIKSEPVPEPSAKQPYLTTLVGSNFDGFVLDESRDVLVEFYTTWCQYCTELHEVINKLGSKHAKAGLSGKVALAKINVEENDVPIRIDGYPSIVLYRAGTNEVVSFEGNFTKMLTSEQLDEFISSRGGHGVSALGQSQPSSRDEL